MESYELETRSSHPSSQQADALISFLETRPFLVKGCNRTPSARERAKKEWYRITLKLNSIPNGTVKTMQRWMKYWSDKKSAIKKKQMTIEKSKRLGISYDVPELSEAEERILAMIKKCASTNTFQLYKRNIKKEPTPYLRVRKIKSRLELDLRMLDVIERNIERDYQLTQAVKAVGEGLKALAEAINKKRPFD